MILKPGKVNVIVDGQWGSTGKGKLAGWLYVNEDVSWACCDFMPNAGHTVVWDDGVTHIFKQLPVAVAFGVRCYVGPYASIDIDQLNREVDEHGAADRVWVHPMAAVVADEDRKQEQITSAGIAGTCQGGHSAQIRKMRRVDCDLARDHQQRIHAHVLDASGEIRESVRAGLTVLVETAQGFSLSLNWGQFPYVTGRDCLLGRVFDNLGMSPRHLGSVIASIRTFPIRVGSTQKGSSGPAYDKDHKERDWGWVSRKVGMQVQEMTTVTKRIRRVFDFSWSQLDAFLDACEPDYAFINFVNYLGPGWENHDFIIRLRDVLQRHNCNLCLFGTGPAQSDMVDQTPCSPPHPAGTSGPVG